MEAAHGGTLFLDEVTEMAQTVQAKLLRVVQDGVVRRLGSSGPDAVVDVRFIAATNRNPREALDEGILRRDLYYRLRVVPIHLPPLRERVSDIPILARHFLGYHWQRHRGSEGPAPVLGDAAIRELQTWPWYGNVRELGNVMEHAVVLLEPGAQVEPGQIPGFQDDPPPAAKDLGPELLARYDGDDFHTGRDRLVADFEKHYVQSVVRRADGNMSQAAAVAGVDRKTLFRLRRKHGLDRKDFVAPGAES
jgi:DNA-binding NtrC family response regulator